MKKLFLAAPAAFVFSFTINAHAQAILAVDFNLSGNANSVTETGFTAITLTSGTTSNPTYNINGYSINLPASTNSARYTTSLTENGTFTYDDLLEDFAVQLTRTSAASNGSSSTDATNIAQAKTLAPTAHTFTVSALQPNTSYTIQLWSVDVRNSGGTGQGAINAWWDTTNGTGASAVQIGWIANSTFNNLGSTLSDNNAYSVVGTVTSDSSGTIRIGQVVSGSANGGVLNGFVISVIPEPASAAGLLGTGAIAFAALRRRRRVSV